jgi:1,2-diacylglycerol 3-beta-galactosyltransferase
MNKRKILILTADAGYGHRSAANAIKAALRELYGDQCELRIENPIGNKDTPKFIQQFEQTYDDSVTKTPELYLLSYHALEAPLISDVAKAVVAQLLNGVMHDLIDEFRPDVIVSTYLFYARAVAKVTEDLEIDCPLAVVITDLTDVQSLWYSSAATMHFVPTPKIRQQAYENNVPGTRVRVTGLPVNPAIIRETRGPAEIRKELGWNEEMFTCLVVSGPRTQKMADITQALDKVQELQVVVVCGGNSELYEELKQTEWEGTVHLYDWVEQMPQLLKASDFIVSKAGGLIVSEALASSLPMIIPEALPGQETGNKEYVIENQAGVWAPKTEDVLKVVTSWLDNDSALLREMKSNATKLGKPQAAYDIAKGLWGLSGGDSPVQEE